HPFRWELVQRYHTIRHQAIPSARPPGSFRLSTRRGRRNGRACYESFLGVSFLGVSFLASSFLASSFLASSFLASSFLASSFLASSFMPSSFLASSFLLVSVFLPSAFLVSFLPPVVGDGQPVTRPSRPNIMRNASSFFTG